jgi:hypothetical protein
MVIFMAPPWLTERRSRERSPCAAFSRRRRTRRSLSLGNTHSSEPARLRRLAPRKPVNTNRPLFSVCRSIRCAGRRYEKGSRPIEFCTRAGEPPSAAVGRGSETKGHTRPCVRAARWRDAPGRPCLRSGREGPSVALVPQSAPNKRSVDGRTHEKTSRILRIPRVLVAPKAGFRNFLGAALI